MAPPTCNTNYSLYLYASSLSIPSFAICCMDLSIRRQEKGHNSEKKRERRNNSYLGERGEGEGEGGEGDRSLVLYSSLLLTSVSRVVKRVERSSIVYGTR